MVALLWWWYESSRIIAVSIFWARTGTIIWCDDWMCHASHSGPRVRYVPGWPGYVRFPAATSGIQHRPHPVSVAAPPTVLLSPVTSQEGVKQMTANDNQKKNKLLADGALTLSCLCLCSDSWLIWAWGWRNRPVPGGAAQRSVPHLQPLALRPRPQGHRGSQRHPLLLAPLWGHQWEHQGEWLLCSLP